MGKGLSEICLCLYLKMWIGHTSRDLFKQRLLDFFELRRLNDVQNLLDLTQKHHLLREKSQNRKRIGGTIIDIVTMWSICPAHAQRSHLKAWQVGYCDPIHSPSSATLSLAQISSSHWAGTSFKKCNVCFSSTDGDRDPEILQGTRLKQEHQGVLFGD